MVRPVLLLPSPNLFFLVWELNNQYEERYHRITGELPLCVRIGSSCRTIHTTYDRANAPRRQRIEGEWQARSCHVLQTWWYISVSETFDSLQRYT